MASKKARGGRLRLWVQAASAALSNGYLVGFARGNIFKGRSKAVCLPGLNCYSCPGAIGACPIGSLQAVLGHRSYQFAFYVLGFLTVVGALGGRFVCGWLCPFGLIQDLLFKIPFFKKLRKLPGDRFLKYLKYVMLVVLVILLPLYAVDFLGQGSPWFCKYVCPAGTLEGGLPLVAANSGLQAAVGWLFAWKNAILIAIIVLSLLVYRPFCRYLCPLGGIYGLFNPISLYRIRLDSAACTQCGACQKACKLGIDIFRHPGSPDCIRCGACTRACPHGAITMGITSPCKGGQNSRHCKKGDRLA